jgi:hypothetical protein
MREHGPTVYPPSALPGNVRSSTPATPSAANQSALARLLHRGQTNLTAKERPSMTKKYYATMTLPKGAKESWSKLMSGEDPGPPQIKVGEPIVEATAVFEDGVKVIGGVEKSATPTEYNIKFMRVFDAHGGEHPSAIDCSDEEDFRGSGYEFRIREDEPDDKYTLEIVEAETVRSLRT